MENLNELLKKSFGGDDFIFCTGTRESENAKLLLKFIIAKDISFSEFENEVRLVLKNKGVKSINIIKELKKINKLSNYLN